VAYIVYILGLKVYLAEMKPQAFRVLHILSKEIFTLVDSKYNIYFYTYTHGNN